MHYSRVSADIYYEQVPPEPAAVLGKVATAEDVGKALESYNPPQPGYKALKAKLAEARGKDGGANEMALLWVLNYSDGEHDLLDIAEKANLPFAKVRAASEILLETGLLKSALSER